MGKDTAEPDDAAVLRKPQASPAPAPSTKDQTSYSNQPGIISFSLRPRSLRHFDGRSARFRTIQVYPKDLEAILEDDPSAAQKWEGFGNLRRRVPTGRANPLEAKLKDRTMSTSEGVQKRNAFAAFAAFRLQGLEASLTYAREIAVRQELDAVGHYIEEAQGYLAQIRALHEEALAEFSRAQGE
jgi:hypothetical protein